MEKYQFKIEDVIIQNPEGWKDFELRLKRDEDISGLLVSSTNKFTFKKDGYDILKARFDVNYNDKLNVTIDILQSDNTYIEQYSGVVILTDVSFNLEKRLAEATIEDASFQGAIQGNKNVKTFLNAGLTKNGEQVSVTAIFNLDYFNAAGVYQGLANRRAILLKDALDFLVRFMTDDEVKGVQSAYLDDVNNFEGDSLLYITTGINIRLANQDAPNVSFAQCITFLQRTHDLTFDFVINSDGDPVMRIEESEFFFNASTIDTIRSITDLKVKVDANRIASHLEVGNNTFRTGGNCSATTRWFTFVKEDYSLRGKGNIDKLLDLTTDFITDNNGITSQAIGGRDIDNEIIIIMGNTAGTQATRFQNADHCSNLFIYNLGFTNDNVVDRMLGAIPNSVTKYLTAATTPSKAELGQLIQVTVTTLNVPVIFNNKINFIDEKYALGNNYDAFDPNNTFYDVPFAGKFSFEIQVKVIYRIVSTTGAGTTALLNPAMSLLRFDSTFTIPPKETVSVGSFLDLIGFVGDTVTITHTISATMDCAGGDRIQVLVGTGVLEANGLTNINLTIDQGGQNTFFKCLGSEDDSGTFKVFDPNSFRARKYTFEKNLSLTRTDKIRANTRNSIVINELLDTNFDKEVWIEEMVNNIDTGATSFTMIN